MVWKINDVFVGNTKITLTNNYFEQQNFNQYLELQTKLVN